ncbi:MAG: class I SAM-dependent methyltransferase, partial [Bdellovibrionia bacterium]
EDKLIYGYALARTTHFTVQQMTLPVFEFLLTGKTKARPKNYTENLKAIFPDLLKLLKEDAANIQAGLYPIEVLKPENPVKHFTRYPQIIFDGVSIAKRRNNKKAHEFGQEEQNYMQELPEYYKRNFHFQTGGYLTEQSADLYEHQVEILFAGAADAMRRMIIQPLKAKYPGDGEGLHFLEVAAGTGRLTRFVKLAFPKAKVTVLDLSEPYLKQAQEKLKEFKHINFVQGAGESLPFQNESFDAVYSCYLFHEIPMDVRQKVIAEGLRVLKPGGFYGAVDSIQLKDTEQMTWALEQFPVDFHEPFYKNYTQHPLEDLFAEQGVENIESRLGFFSKVASGTKAQS